MTILFLRRVGITLHADGDESISELLSLPFGKTLKAEVKQPRNPAFHRLYFAMCKRIADGIGKDAEQVSTVFKYATGHYDTLRTKTYGDVKVAKSISFAQLDETGFREFFNKCVAVALTEWGIEPEALSDLIDTKTERRACAVRFPGGIVRFAYDNGEMVGVTIIDPDMKLPEQSK